MNDEQIVVAVDGPAGSGKSSVSRRPPGRSASTTRTPAPHTGRSPGTRSSAGSTPKTPMPSWPCSHDFDYAIGVDPDDYFVRVGETDVTDAIREPRVSAVVSEIARVPAVRAHLTGCSATSSRAGERPGVITEGRDITTVVAPDAQVRILLTASEEARMARRSAEVTGQSAQLVGQQLSARDAQDSRVVDFLNAADGVTTIDSTFLDFDQTVAAVVDLVHTVGRVARSAYRDLLS